MDVGSSLALQTTPQVATQTLYSSWLKAVCKLNLAIYVRTYVKIYCYYAWIVLEGMRVIILKATYSYNGLCDNIYTRFDFCIPRHI